MVRRALSSLAIAARSMRRPISTILLALAGPVARLALLWALVVAFPAGRARAQTVPTPPAPDSAAAAEAPDPTLLWTFDSGG